MILIKNLERQRRVDLSDCTEICEVLFVENVTFPLLTYQFRYVTVNVFPFQLIVENVSL